MISKHLKTICDLLIVSMKYTFFVYMLALMIPIKGYSAKIVDRIVAVVNDDIIPLSELNQATKPYSEKIMSLNYTQEKEREMLFKVRDDILNELINRKLTDQEIKRAKINITEKEIDLNLERIKENSFLTDEELRKALSQQGLSMEEYREKLKDQLLRTKLVNIKIRSKIVITEEDIKSYYEKHYNQYKGEEKYHLHNIIMRIPPFATEADKQKVRERMEVVLEKLNDGESFEMLARTYSEAPMAAAKGGNLGLFRIQDISPQLQDAIKGLQAGDHTPIMGTDQGYQIFYVQNIVGTPEKSLKEVTPEIQEKLFNEIINERYRTWLEELRTKSHIRIIK